MNKEDPTQGIPDWLQPFTDNLEDLETHVKRKHSKNTHFSEYRICDRCLRAKIARVPCRARDEGSFPRAEKFGDGITADHKVFNEGCESRHHHRYTVVVQDLGTQWIQSYPCKTKTSQEDGEEFATVSGAVARCQKLLIGTIQMHLNLASLVKNYHGIIEQLHLIDQRQAKLQKELYVE